VPVNCFLLKSVPFFIPASIISASAIYMLPSRSFLNGPETYNFASEDFLKYLGTNDSNCSQQTRLISWSSKAIRKHAGWCKKHILDLWRGKGCYRI